MSREQIDWSAVQARLQSPHPNPVPYYGELAQFSTPLDDMPEVVRAAYELSTMTTMSFYEALSALEPIYESRLLQENKTLIDELASYRTQREEREALILQLEREKEHYRTRYNLFRDRTDQFANERNRIQSILDMPFSSNTYKSAGAKLRGIRQMLNPNEVSE